MDFDKYKLATVLLCLMIPPSSPAQEPADTPAPTLPPGVYPSPPAPEAAKLGSVGVARAFPKIEAAVYQAAQEQTILPLLVTLKNQPQQDILRRVEAANVTRLRVAEGRYRDVAARFAPKPEDLEAAQRDVDSIILANRRQASAEIETAVRPAQDLMETKLLSWGATNIRRYTAINMLRADVPTAALEFLQGDADVNDVSLIQLREGQINVSSLSLGAPSFWSGTPGITGSGQSVAILDSGVNGHPALFPRVLVNRFLSQNSISCFATQDYTDNTDRVGHGTHVAGIVASQGTALFPSYLGVAYGVSTIYGVKVGCATLTTSPPYYTATFADDDVLSGIQWIALNTPARVLNLSVGRQNPLADPLYNGKIDYLVRTYDLTLVIAAGNDGPAQSLNSPGTAYNVITVAAMNTNATVSRNDDTVSSFSSRGPTGDGRKKPDIAAPGAQFNGLSNTGIFSTDYQSAGFVPKPGTSMAAPHIAGAAVLLRAAGITNPLAIKALLLNTTDWLSWTSDQGWGYCNLQRAYTQRTNSLTGSVAPGQARFFVGSNTGLFYSTVTWNRLVLAFGGNQFILSDLDLRLYDRSSGTLLASSISPLDNVEKASANTNGGVVVKVKNVVSVNPSAEPFGIAFSSGGFVAATGPQLTVNCSGPSSTIANSPFTVTCTATNNGDLEAVNVLGTLNYQGSSGGAQLPFGTLAPGASANRSWTGTAPAAGNYTLVAAVGSTSFGESFDATANFSFISSITGTIPGPTTPGGLRFVSLPPCRIMETRPEYNYEGRSGAFGPPFMTAGETRTLTVPNSTVCQIPAAAKAYVLNVTLVPRGGVDFVTVWPGGEARPNFWTVRSPDGLIVANAAIVKPGAGGTIQVYASHNTDLIIDISGYFTDYSAQVTNLVYYPMTPCRVVDTRQLYRPQTGPFGPPSMEAQVSRRFKFPDTPYCIVPAGAAAYSFTLTAVPQGTLAFMTAWPSNQARPNVSSINSPAGRVLANSVIVPASPDGSIDVFAYNKTDFLVDINGYFAPDDGTNGQYYYPVTQCRVSDSTSALPAPYGGPIYAARTARTIPVTTSGCAGIPAAAKGFALNVTALPGGSSLPYVSAYPAGQAQPNASILNAFEGQVVTNSAIIPAGTNGAVNVYAYEKTHVVVEVSGFFGR